MNDINTREFYKIQSERNVFEAMLINLGHYDTVCKVREILKSNPRAIITMSDIQSLIN